MMSRLMAALQDVGADILDIGQAVIHNELALAVLARVAAIADSRSRIESACASEDVVVRITPVQSSDQVMWSELADGPDLEACSISKPRRSHSTGRTGASSVKLTV